MKKGIAAWRNLEITHTDAPPHVDKLVDEYCNKCRFYSPHTTTCDYFLVTGKRRPCPAGKGCKAREKELRKGGRRIKLDEAKAYELYEQGKNDHEIAQEVGVSDSAIYYWRKSRSLKANMEHRERNMNWDKELARRLYYLRWSDRAIAKVVDVSPYVIGQWRKKEGLPTHGGKK